ncbi:unnamed protein product [Chrysoparadoxa australica]
MEDTLRYKAGMALLKNGEKDKAIDHFGELLAISVEEKGDELHPDLGPLYYAYGDAILRKAESEGGVFGTAIAAAAAAKRGMEKKAAEAAAAVAKTVRASAGGSAQDASAGASAAQPAVPASGADGDDGADDIELAWEVLETARVIFAKDSSPRGAHWLSEVHLRLGEFGDLNGDHAQACTDLNKSLELKKQAMEQDKRAIASLLFQLGNNYLFHASMDGVPASQAAELRTKSLASFAESEVVLADVVQQLEQEVGTSAKDEKEDSAPASSVQKAKADELLEVKDILDTVRETIAAAKGDENALAEQKAGGEQAKVGFGFKNSSEAVVATTLVGKKRKKDKASIE